MLRASWALALATLVAAALPGQAAAHAGLTAPAATSYLASVLSAPAGVEARVVDGDQRLWLRVAAGRVVVVLGLRGEPYLRFSPGGVEVNTRAPTFFLNRARPQAPPVGAYRRAPPRWKRIAASRSTSWHEDRIHALALGAHPAGDAYLGHWLVPLLVDGRRAAVRGELRHVASPSLLWFWPLALALACVPALLQLREVGWDQPALWALAPLALGAATAGRLGRELYGRPTVSAGQLALAATTCAVAAALAALFLRRAWRTLAAVAIGIAGLYQGLALLATLRRGVVLAALPAWAERSATALALAAGGALLLVAVVAPAWADERRCGPTLSGRRAPRDA